LDLVARVAPNGGGKYTCHLLTDGD
jgi:hypothetical protein